MVQRLVRNFLFLFWVCFLLTAALMLFLRGFLLTRIAFTAKNSCQFENTFETIKLQCTDPNNGPKCWQQFLNGSFCLPKSRHRAVILLIDALRYDFTHFNGSKENVLPFENKLPIIHEMLSSRPKHTRLFRFIADPPSTTMQRLKALTTGTLPTFIDAGSNFASSVIEEDNLIYQLESNGRRIVFMGDDTWLSLYPNSFVRKKPFPSFDVWDLDTVDTGIKINLYPELQRTDWDLLWAHFLGVDHCGHRYRPNHPEMARKLSEMDHMIRTVIHMLPDDVVLYVIGDHGMTKSGDHGGFTDNEVTSALFVYSPTQLIEKLRPSGSAIKQINFIPTIASLFGVPIPFSNLGHIVPDILPINLHSNYDRNFLKILQLLLWTNMQQISSYIRNYSIQNQNDFTSTKMAEFNQYFTNLENHKFLIDSKPEYFEQYLNSSEQMQRSILSLCESIWIQFDSSSMARGLILMLIILILFTFIIIEFDTQSFESIFSLTFLRHIYSSLIVLSLIVLFFTLLIRFKYEIYIYFYSLIISIFATLLVLLKTRKLKPKIMLDYAYERLYTMDFVTYVYLALILGFNAAQFSDNGVIYEGSVTIGCMLVYIIWTWYLCKPRTRNKLVHLRYLMWYFVLTVICYVSTFFHACREENMHNCTNYIKNLTYEQFSCIIALITVWIFVTVLKNWLRTNGSLVETSWRCFQVRYFPTAILVCCGCIWVFEKFLDGRNLTIKRQMNLLAYIIYTLIFTTIFHLVKEPVFLTVFQSHYRTDKDSSQRKKKIFDQWKNQKYSQNELGLTQCPIIYGAVNVYSSCYVAISMFLILLMTTLIGELLAPSIVLMYAAVTVFLFIMSINRFDRMNSFSELYELPNSYLIGWFLMSVLFFYGTNHQPTFPNIHWSAAFVGDLHLISNTLAAVAILLNTYCSQVFFAFMLPVLFFAPFQLQSILATVFHCRNAHLFWYNGEMILAKHKELVHNSILQLYTKYILLHGIRVFFVVITSTANCRHLLVWNIFAPKFVFEAIGLLVTFLAVLFSYCFLIRIQIKIDQFLNRTKLHD